MSAAPEAAPTDTRQGLAAAIAHHGDLVLQHAAAQAAVDRLESLIRGEGEAAREAEEHTQQLIEELARLDAPPEHSPAAAHEAAIAARLRHDVAKRRADNARDALPAAQGKLHKAEAALAKALADIRDLAGSVIEAECAPLFEELAAIHAAYGPLVHRLRCAIYATSGQWEATAGTIPVNEPNAAAARMGTRLRKLTLSPLPEHQATVLGPKGAAVILELRDTLAQHLAAGSARWRQYVEALRQDAGAQLADLPEPPAQ